MKNLFLIIIFFIGISCKSQTYPLTETIVPSGSYISDTQNQLTAFEGNWMGTWKGKTILINFKKIIHGYDDHDNCYRDYLIGKFQVKDASGNILFDNLTIPDNNAKIQGKRIFANGTYSLTYGDDELCFKSGFIRINFNNSAKTEIRFKFTEISQLIEPDCFYHGKPADQRPEPLPKEIILTKQ